MHGNGVSRTLISAVLLLLCTSVLVSAGDAPIPDGFDHEPVIMTKEKLASLKAPKLHDNVPPAAGGAHALPVDGVSTPKVEAAVPLSPSVPSDGRFAPRHSFTGPYTSKLLANWEIGAGATVDEHFVRLTPAKQSRTGYCWNTQQVEMSDWEVIFEFQVQGRKDIGGDGFALWFVERPEVLGLVYGSTDYWNGLGLFFDTFNNDAVGKSPLISAVFNDGTLKYDASSDGATQALESCSVDFRNRPEPTVARLRFLNHVLSLELAVNRDKSNNPVFEKCFSMDAIELGVDKYFGVTAHTGDVADSHDIFKFEVRDLSPAVVDLDAIRNKYSQEVHHQQQEHEHHHSMTSDEFQHAVLTYLSQIQGEVNMLETSQIDIQEYVTTAREEKFQKQQELDAAKAAGTHVEGGAGIDAATQSRLATMSENQATVMNDLKRLSEAVSKLAIAPVGASAGGQTPSGPGGRAVPGTVPPTGSVEEVKKAISDLATKIMPAQDLQSQLKQIREEVDTALAKQTQNVLEVQRTLNNLASTLSNIERAGVSGASAASIAAAAGLNDWIMYVCVIFSAVCLSILSCHTLQQHRSKDRWKMP